MVIVIDLEGGLIQNVIGSASPTTEVFIRDYDIEGCDDEQLTEDSKGNQYVSIHPTVELSFEKVKEVVINHFLSLY